MNSNCYRLVFNPTLGTMVPVAETARRMGKTTSGPALALASVLLATPAFAAGPVACTAATCAGVPGFASYGQAGLTTNAAGTTTFVDQVGSKAIVNFKSFDVSKGHNVQFGQVDSLATRNYVPGADFTVLGRIYSNSASVIAGSIRQAAGQKANVILVNTNGIAFTGTAEVNLNSFIASSLDIKDKFITGSLLPSGSVEAQFVGDTGYIKVFEGAKISAGQYGRVMLIAPTVVNQGTITAPDGQIVLAAANKVYLRAATGGSQPDSNVRGLLVEISSPNAVGAVNTSMQDLEFEGQKLKMANGVTNKLGVATNLGTLDTPRGNITMIGNAVNQMGFARASTSVVSNGSVYLLAKDQSITDGGNWDTVGSKRAGVVTLGENSVTEVLPDVADTTTSTDSKTAGAGLENKSQVLIVGNQIHMAKGAVINAPSGEVNMYAVDIPGLPVRPIDLFKPTAAASDTARIHIEDGAVINVAGQADVQVSAERNSVKVELRGDELKDSPVNQSEQGPLRGETVYVDVNAALTNANAGKSTLIAKDSLEAYQAKLGRTVAERSTSGGSVNLYSQGEAIVQSGAKIDLSGGKVQYTAANLKTTLLTKNGSLVDIANATADTQYDGISTRIVLNYKKWNKEEVIDLGQSYKYEAGYTEGQNAGSANVFGMKTTYMQADVQGRTVAGERQRNAGIQPTGASLTLGYNDTVSNQNLVSNDTNVRDYKLNQNVDVTSAAALLPTNFKFGDALTQELKDKLTVNNQMLGKDKVAVLNVYSNKDVTVRDSVRTPQGGGVAIIGSNVTVNADIEAGSGSINLAARNTVATYNTTTASAPNPQLKVADGVTLSARGAWVNQLPGTAAGDNAVAMVNGGSIALSAEAQANGTASYISKGEVTLGKGTLLDANSGAWVKANGAVQGGNGGSISVAGYSVTGLDKNVQAYGVNKGGKISVASNRIKIGGTPEAQPGSLQIDPSFFARGGFADFKLTAYDKLTVADNTTVTPTVQNLDLQTSYRLAPTGSRIEDFSNIGQRIDRVRQAANLTFVASQSKAGTGDIEIGKGANIQLDPKAALNLQAFNQIQIQGRLATAGGSITAEQTRKDEGIASSAAHVIWLGSEAQLDVSGKPLTYTDGNGLTKGEVVAGGAVALNTTTGSVVTQAGSRIDVSGAAPVRLDVPNETGGLGRSVGSDAGTVTVTVVKEGAVLDGTMAAAGGSAANRGGTFDLAVGETPSPTNPLRPQTLSLAQTTSPQAFGPVPNQPIAPTDVVRARVGADKLEAAGFDRIKLASAGTIALENGLNLGANRALPLREVKLDAARIETKGGNAAVTAETVLMGNYKNTDAVVSPVSNTGTLTVNAKQLELAGNLRLEGMARAELNGAQAVYLAGYSGGSARPAGSLTAKADLAFSGGVIAPTTYSDYTITAEGKTVSFSRNTDAPEQPLSAMGSVTVKAQNIEQGGNLWAPFGQIVLEADDTLTLKDGSLTSVAAAPGSIIPFGKLVNGKQWIYDVNPTSDTSGKLEQTTLTGKSIRTTGKTVDQQAGAKVSVAGGGDMQAYEFTVGPGGSKDILLDANTYAILPGYKGGIAPGDVQETKGFNRAVGEAVYLSGMPGLKDGVYTLLPAHYALLPGGMAVRLNTTSGPLMPGQAYTRDDGVRMAAGYVTDSRANAPKDANWSGIQVLTQAQVRARSEITLTKASDFFANSNGRPQDAGLLSIKTTGTGSGSLSLLANYNLAAGTGGRGAALDISAQELEITSGTSAGTIAGATKVSVEKLNSLGAESVFLGGTRTVGADSTTLNVDAQTVTLSNDLANPLKAGEVILAAKDTVTLAANSAIDAQGTPGNAGNYTVVGDGALLRAAATTATMQRTGTSAVPTKGTLVGDASSLVRAADSITTDATFSNAFKGKTQFGTTSGSTFTETTGNLAVGANKVNLGNAPTSAAGLTYSQAELDALSKQKSLTLTSYSGFDVYGGVNVGAVDATGKPVLQNLTLQGAGLAGIDNAGQTATVRAQNVTLKNPDNSTFAPGAALGTGGLNVQADTITLGAGNKQVQGFNTVTLTANELVGSGQGSTTVTAATTTVNVARIRGEKGADQTLTATNALDVQKRSSDRTLDTVTALGAKWALEGTSVNFNTQAVLPSGTVVLKANGASGDVTLGANAEVDVAGRAVKFYDVTKPTWGGTADFGSDNGNVTIAAGAKVDVSGAAGADGGMLKLSATRGTVTVADGSVIGNAPAGADGKRGDGALAIIDTGTLASYSNLNTALNSGGFDFARDLRVRNGDVTVAGDTAAKNIRIAADAGKLNVNGRLDASGTAAGRVELYATGDVNIYASAQINAASSGAGKDGGDIEIGTREGTINLAHTNPFNVAAGTGGAGGTVLLRAPRTGTGAADGSGAGAGTGVAISALPNPVANGARSVSVEAVKVYNGITTLNATGAASGSTQTLAAINADNAAFAANAGAIKTSLGAAASDANFRLLTGVEVRSAGDLALGNGTAGTDWNMQTSRADGQPGVLTLSATGKLNINSNLSDGFSAATPCTTTTCSVSNPSPAALQAGNSWSYRLVSGADRSAANPLGVKAPASAGAADFNLAAGKLIRTGTGNIQVASGGNVVLADNRSVIYTAGRVSDPLAGFVTPAAVLRPVFGQGGGDVSLQALGDVTGKPAAQIYSEWLYRQGALNATTGAYTQQPAWWVRYDQFQQGVGALGGGNVTISAGGKVKDVSASTPTQGRMASSTPDASKLVVTGGGDLRVSAGTDVLGGEYYADRGDLVVKAGGKVGTSDQNVVGAAPLATLLALGDAKARVQAAGDITISNILSPQLVAQSTGNLATAVGVSKRYSAFSTYSADSGVDLQSLSGAVNIAPVDAQVLGKISTTAITVILSSSSTETNTPRGDRSGAPGDLYFVLPPNLAATAFQGSIQVNGKVEMSPAANGSLSLLAADSIQLNSVLRMSDRDPATLPNAVAPAVLAGPGLKYPTLDYKVDTTNAENHAASPIHAADTTPARIYAVNGDVTGKGEGSALSVPKQTWVRAGRDVRDLPIYVQHSNATDVSRIEAGRDILFTGTERSIAKKIWVAGPGLLEVFAGRNVDLGTSAGIVSRGNLDNPNLPAQGADILVLAGAGPKGLDAAGAIDRLVAKLQGGAIDEPTLWLARWLTGNNTLTAANALGAVTALQGQDAKVQSVRVRDMVFTALRTTGRDHNDPASPFAGDYARGYAAIELVFPGIGEKNPDGSFKNYQGDINLFASRIKSEQGGSIQFMVPGGDLIVGLANTPDSLVNSTLDGVKDNPLGIIVASAGDIKGFTRGDMTVNQSRILTVGGGDVLLWSSEGDIDAGKGKKTASAVPPPIITVDSDGNVTQVLQGAVNGSGIGALKSNGRPAGDVDLITPKGSVNAGDAGIRAGNLNVAAIAFIGAGNTDVAGKTTGGAPVDTSAVNATASGATSAGNDISKTLNDINQAAAESAKNAEDAKKAVKAASVVRVEVVGYGE